MEPNFEAFNVSGIKLSKDGNRVIVNGAMGNEDTTGNRLEFKELTKNAVPHPDFLKTMNKFRSMVLRCYGYGQSNIKKLSPDVKMIGISFSGSEEDENLGVIISAKMPVKGGSVTMNTPRIVFGRDVVGIEDDVENMCEDLKVETYDYLYEDKRADPELPLEGDGKIIDFIEKAA